MEFDRNAFVAKNKAEFDPDAFVAANSTNSTVVGNALNALSKGVTAEMDAETQQEYERIRSPQDQEFDTANKFYGSLLPEGSGETAVKQRIKLEYGEDATPQVANAYNKKPLQYFDLDAYNEAESEKFIATLPKISDYPKVIAGDLYDTASDVIKGAVADVLAIGYAKAGQRDFELEKELVEKGFVRDTGLTQEKATERIAELEKSMRAGLGDVAETIKEAKPEKFEKAQQLVSEYLTKEDVNIVEKGSWLLAQNFWNMASGSAGLAVGFATMYSREKGSMVDDLENVIDDQEIIQDASQKYGLISGAIEQVEQLGRVRSAFGTQMAGKGIKKQIIKKLGTAGINVGEETLQQLTLNILYNDAIEKYNEKYGTNYATRELPQGLADAAEGSLAMTIVLEALGLSAKGIRKATRISSQTIEERKAEAETIKRVQQKTPFTLGEAVFISKHVRETADIPILVDRYIQNRYDQVEREKLTTLFENTNEKTLHDYNEYTFQQAPLAMFTEKDGDGMQDAAEDQAPKTKEEVIESLDEVFGESAQEEELDEAAEEEQGSAEDADEAQEATEDADEEEPTANQGETFGTARADMDEFMQELEGENTPDPDFIAHVESAKLAFQEGIIDNADDVALEILGNEDRAATHKEVAGMLVRGVKLRKEIRALRKQAKEAADNGDTAGFELLNDKLNVLEGKASNIILASVKSGERLGRALSSMAMRMHADTYEVDHVIEKMTIAKGETLTEEERGKAQETVEKINEIQDEIGEDRSGERSRRKTGNELKDELESLTEELENDFRSIERGQSEQERKKKLGKKEKSEIAKVKEAINDKDSLFDLLDQLENIENIVEENDTKLVEDPYYYKRMIKNVTKLIRENYYYQKMKKSSSKYRKRQIENLENTLKNLEDQFKGKYRRIKKVESIDSDDVLSLKERIKDIREDMRVEDEIALIKDDLRKIREGKVAEVKKNREKGLDKRRKEMSIKRVELNHLKRQLNDQLKELDRSKGKQRVMKSIEFLRANILSMDSWVGRQGSKALLIRPAKTLKAFKQSLPAWVSEAYYYEVDEMNKNRRSAKHGALHGLELMDIDGEFDAHQEAVNSQLAEKLPWIRGGNRSMVLGLNTLRINEYARIYNRYPNESKEFYEAAANYVNILTGRGNLYKFEAAARGLTGLFTAPRWATSNFEIVYEGGRALVETATGKTKLDNKLAKEIAKDFAKGASMFGAIAGGLIATGWSFGTEPEEGDFLRFRKGDKVFDPLPGLSSSLRLLGFLGEGLAAAFGAGELETKMTFGGVWKNFINYKEAPALAIIQELADKKTKGYDERKAWETLLISTQSIMLQTIYQDLHKDEKEFEDVLWETGVQWFGFGANLYEKKDNKKKKKVSD